MTIGVECWQSVQKVTVRYLSLGFFALNFPLFSTTETRLTLVHVHALLAPERGQKARAFSNYV